MSAWLPLALPLLVALGIIAVLGLPAAFALRLRGFAIALVAIPAAFAVLALSAIIAGFAGISWNLLVPFAFAVVLALVLFAVRRLLGTAPTTRPRPHGFWLPVGAAAIGGAAIATTLVMSMKYAGAVSQTYDANFHLNAVQQILHTADASPFDLDLATPGNPVFYPAVWHGFVALIAQISGTSIPLATNGALFAACCVIWPVGAVALGRAIAGPGRVPTLASGVISAAFPNFPFVLAGYGVLYPNLLATTLLPFAFVGALQLLGLAQARRSDPLSVGSRWLLFLGAFGAAALSHPNAVHITLLWCAFPVLSAAVHYLRGDRAVTNDGTLRLRGAKRPALKVLTVASLIGYLLLIVVAWYFGRTTDNPWEGTRNVVGAMVDAAGSTPHLEGHAWPATLLVLAGMVLVWRRRSLRWAFGTAAVLYIACIVADGFPGSWWRTMLLSPWYNDTWRLASLISLGALPLAVIGAKALLSVARLGTVRAARLAGSARLRPVFSGFAIVMLLAVTQGAGAFAGVQYVSSKYVDGDNAPVLSQDERALLERLDEHVPAGESIIDNPWNGGALAYAISDRAVLNPHLSGNYDPRILELHDAIEDVDGAKVCELADDLGAHYMLDFGSRYVFAGSPKAEPFESITDINREVIDETATEEAVAAAEAQGMAPEEIDQLEPVTDTVSKPSAALFEEVDREGEAVLYRLVDCN